MNNKSAYHYFYVKKWHGDLLMRILLLFFCTATFSLTPVKSFSQNEITINSDKKVSVEEVFELFKTKTSFRFVYQSDMFDGFPSIYLEKGTYEVKELLENIFRNTGISFTFFREQVILIKNKNVEKELKISEQQQVQGKVTSKEGMPLIGATVLIKGTRMGTITNFDGEYSIEVSNPDAVLVFSYVGYETKEVAVDSREDVDVVLAKKRGELEQVVIVGYGKTKKSDFTGSVGSVTSEDIDQIRAQTVDQALVGKIPGVFVSAQSGGPGSGAIVHVRGLSQLIGDNQPLYVVDGVPIVINPRFSGDLGLSNNRQNPLLAINPADIERVDVLKDASSAAIYGSRAANGVVLITTKRGNRNQAPRFTFSYSSTIQNPTNTYDVLNAADFKNFIIEQGLEEDITFGTANTDWQDEITNNNALWNQYGMSISGGSENINYRASGHVTDQEGIMVGNTFKRYSFSTSIDADLTDKFRVGTNISYNYALNKRSALNSLGAGAFYRPDLAVFNEDGTYTAMDFSGISFRNPLGDEAKVRNNAISQYLLGTIYGEYEIINSLRFKSQLSLNVNNDQSDIFHPSYTRRGVANGALLFIQHSKGISSSWANTIHYNKTFANAHTIDALGGVSWDHSTLNLDSQQYVGFPDDEILTDINSAQDVVDVSSVASQNALNSLFGRLNYNYKDRYLATFTARYDGSIKFGPNNRYGFFPSGALAWNLHNENFLSGSKFLSRLKLRASLGSTGSDNLPAFSYLVNYKSLNGTDSYYDGINGISVDGVPNLDIRWEQTDQLDLGLEFGLFNGRLNGEVVYFEKHTSGIILLVPVPSQTGYSSWNANIADVSNTGWEIELGGDVIRGKDLRWNSSFNISFIKNNVDALNNGATTNFGSTGIIEGQPIGVITGFDVVSIAQTPEEIADLNANAPSGTYYSGLTEPGDYIFRDTNGDNQITNEDIIPLGDINPKFYGGWNNSISYKNFDFSFNFNFVQGNKRNWYRGATQFLSVSTTSNVTTDVYDTWTPDNPNAKYARIGSATHGNNTSTSKNVVAGDYIKLRSASISYNFPNEWLKNTAIENVRFTLSGNNLWTISDYPGIDPESVQSQRGGATVDLRRDTGMAYPQATTFTIALNVSL